MDEFGIGFMDGPHRKTSVKFSFMPKSPARIISVKVQDLSVDGHLPQIRITEDMTLIFNCIKLVRAKARLEAGAKQYRSLYGDSDEIRSSFFVFLVCARNQKATEGRGSWDLRYPDK